MHNAAIVHNSASNNSKFNEINSNMTASVLINTTIVQYMHPNTQ